MSCRLEVGWIGLWIRAPVELMEDVADALRNDCLATKLGKFTQGR